jgi:hypothetical protein
MIQKRQDIEEMTGIRDIYSLTYQKCDSAIMFETKSWILGRFWKKTIQPNLVFPNRDILAVRYDELS